MVRDRSLQAKGCRVNLSPDKIVILFMTPATTLLDLIENLPPDERQHVDEYIHFVGISDDDVVKTQLEVLRKLERKKNKLLKIINKTLNKINSRKGKVNDLKYRKKKLN